VDWIGLAQDRDKWTALVNSVMNLWVPYSAGNLLSGFTISGLSSSDQLHKASLLVGHVFDYHIPTFGLKTYKCWALYDRTLQCCKNTNQVSVCALIFTMNQPSSYSSKVIRLDR
jgi:hypothetical protein